MRRDIQFLRGVAVLLVVAYHAFPKIAPRGFLGVDVFFVISGFLMTRMIASGLEQGNFTFGAFYLRRARRLLPAAFTTFAATAAVGWWLMTDRQWNDFTKQLLGAVTFTANYSAHAQSGYFAGGEASRPLMHIWSLSLEEQFYFAFPLVLWVIPAQRRAWYIAAIAVLSLALCFILASGIPSQRDIAFYFLQSRAWELLAGALAALAAWRSRRWLQVAALFPILATALIGFDDTHPRFDALLAVVATATILTGPDGWLPSMTRPVERVGDWSYSLYLIHWPLLSLTAIAYAGTVPVTVLVGLCVASIGLSALQYRYVEQPWRKPSFRRRWLFLLAAPAAVMACAPVATYRSIPPDPTGEGFSPICDQRGTGLWQDYPECRTGPAPQVALWGDSYAMALLPGVIEAAGNRGVVQMTRSACAPIGGLATHTLYLNRVWGQNCIAFNRSVVEAIKANPSIRTVIIASAWVPLKNTGDELTIGDKITPWSAEVGLAALRATIAELRRAGKRVVLIGSTPAFGADPVQCQQRRSAGLIVFRECDSRPVGSQADQQLSRLSQDVPVLLPRAALCSAHACDLRGMRDAGHLNDTGAIVVARRLKLAAAIR